VGLQIPKKRQQRFDGVLVGFSGELVEVRSYVELRTKFTDGTLASTIIIRYMVMKAPSSYNLLLETSLNRLEL